MLSDLLTDVYHSIHRYLKHDEEIYMRQRLRIDPTTTVFASTTEKLIDVSRDNPQALNAIGEHLIGLGVRLFF